VKAARASLSQLQPLRLSSLLPPPPPPLRTAFSSQACHCDSCSTHRESPAPANPEIILPPLPDISPAMLSSPLSADVVSRGLIALPHSSDCCHAFSFRWLCQGDAELPFISRRCPHRPYAMLSVVIVTSPSFSDFHLRGELFLHFIAALFSSPSSSLALVCDIFMVFLIHYARRYFSSFRFSFAFFCALPTRYACPPLSSLPPVFRLSFDFFSFS